MALGAMGPDSPIDRVADEYFPNLPESWLHEIFEDETNLLLAAILMELGGADTLLDQPLTGESITRRVGVMAPAAYEVIETADLEDANPDGTITLEPGDTATLVEYDAKPHGLLAVGAQDAADVQYRLESRTHSSIGGWTESPLGTIPSPFSFVTEFGGGLGIPERSRYRARLAEDASGPVDLAARVHLEVVDQ